jgi:hypothetical protein
MMRFRTILLPLAAIGVATAVPAGAQTRPLGLSVTGQPTAFDVKDTDYVADGYRGAKWSMTIDQVRAAAMRDFPGATLRPTTIDPVNRTTILVVNVPRLAPGPGPMAITYVFGLHSARLFHINLDWSFDRPTSADRVTLTSAGAAVLADLLSYQWKLFSVARGIATGPNTLVLFTGADAAGHRVGVELQGIGYALQRPGGTAVTMPAPASGTPALLHVSFDQGVPPDIYTIEPGDF